MRSPVAIIVFNRPDLTERVFAEIARARPRQLLVIADGPRPGHADDEAKCAATRAIIDRVDWPCDVLKNYSDVNLGVGWRPATGLRWVFEQVEEAIILEDDCLPHPTFFQYCDELLEAYRDDRRVMHISGGQLHFSQQQRPFSYFFSCYCWSWGWATWRRAFQYYDPDLRLWPSLRDTSWLIDLLGDPKVVEFWQSKFDLAYSTGPEHTGWDWQWLFACWAHHGLSILPRTSLISNLGFGGEATHTKSPDDPRANVPMVGMTFPLTHPPCMVRDTEADRAIMELLGVGPAPQRFYEKLRQKSAAVLPAALRQFVSSIRSQFASP